MAFLTSYDASAALPEIALALMAMALLMYGVFKRGEVFDHVLLGSVAALALTAVFVILGPQSAQGFGGTFIVDNFAQLMKVLVLVGAGVALVLASGFMQRHKAAQFEYPVLVLLCCVGMMGMISANSLISLYMGLELQSLALYVVAAFDRDSAKSSEAGLKYFILGALSSGLLLFGCSYVYGFTGATEFSALGQSLATAQGTAHFGLITGLVFILAGLAFKISAVPFHMWTPDVYEGAPTPVTAFLAAAPKIAAMALLVRVTSGPFLGLLHDWRQIVVLLAIASMVLGAFAGLVQTNIKRLIAYSSIGHMGYALVGLAAGTEEGVRGVVAYMLIYAVTTLGFFACVVAMRHKGRQLVAISDLAGLSQTNKGLAFMLSMLMFSLAGIPPLAGFFGKAFVFMAAVQSGLYVLAVIGVLASVVSAYYYLRIVKLMYFDEPVERLDTPDGEVTFVAYASGIFSLAFILFVNYVLVLAETAARSLF